MMLLPLSERFGDDTQYIAARIRTGNVSETLDFIENTWENFAPGYPFTYSFLDEDFNRLYVNEQRKRKVSVIFSMLAIFISSLGLFGLASFITERRTKEVGVRKVLGATVTNITLLLSKDFVKWVLIANVIAWPIAYFSLNRWLHNFAYRIDIGVWLFVISGISTLVIALLTVSYQSVKAAVANPVESLRSE